MISIIIPTFNRGHLLPRAVDSILRQTSSQWELIIVDDGSTDNTSQVASAYLHDKRISYIVKPNSGASASRNKGVEVATFRWITFLDSDDEAKPNWIERILAQIADNVGVISNGLIKVDETGRILGTLEPEKDKGTWLSGAYTLKKAIFVGLGGFDLTLASNQHTEFSIRVKKHIRVSGETISTISDSLVIVHIHSGMRIRNSYQAKYEGTLTAYKSEAFKEWMSRPKARAQYESIIAFNAFKLKKYNEAMIYSLKSIRSYPFTLEGMRFIRYLLRIDW